MDIGGTTFAGGAWFEVIDKVSDTRIEIASNSAIDAKDPDNDGPWELIDTEDYEVDGIGNWIQVTIDSGRRTQLG